MLLYCPLVSIQKNNLFKVYFSSHISIRLFRPEALIHIIGNGIVKSLMQAVYLLHEISLKFRAVFFRRKTIPRKDR